MVPRFMKHYFPTEVSGVTDPAPGVPAAPMITPSGIYKQSEFIAAMVELDQDGSITSGINLGIGLFNPCMLFCQGAPLQIRARLAYGPHRVNVLNAQGEPDGSYLILNDPNLDAQVFSRGNIQANYWPDMITPEAGYEIPGSKQAARFNTVTNAVNGILGWPIDIRPTDQGIINEAAVAIVPGCALTVNSTSVTDEGNPAGDAYVVGDDLAAGDVIQIILNEADYTPAMRAAGNVYTDPVSGVIHPIVGIFLAAVER